MPKTDLNCPQKTVIEYPDLPRKNKYKFSAVDFIPRKRHEEEILNEIDAMKKKPAVAYGKRGVDRNRMIEELQEINHFGDKKHLEAAMAKERAMRQYMKDHPVIPDNQQRLKSKYNQQIARTAMKHYEEKYGQNPANILFDQGADINLNKVRSKQDEELQDLFDQICYEIEERQ